VAHPYERLTPASLLFALEAGGIRGDGRLLQLNSYENRVFQVMLEDGCAVAAKFYRPARWSDEQILEEHDFAGLLAAHELPVIAPLTLTITAPPAGAAPTRGLGHPPTLARRDDDGIAMRWAAYPMRSGHGPELDDTAVLQWLGRFVGRMHAVTGSARFTSRQTLDPQTFGRDRLQALLRSGSISASSRRSKSAKAV